MDGLTQRINSGARQSDVRAPVFQVADGPSGLPQRYAAAFGRCCAESGTYRAQIVLAGILDPDRGRSGMQSGAGLSKLAASIGKCASSYLMGNSIRSTIGDAVCVQIGHPKRARDPVSAMKKIEIIRDANCARAETVLA